MLKIIPGKVFNLTGNNIITHPNVWQFVQVEKVEQVEKFLCVVVCDKPRCVDNRSHSVNNPTVFAFKRCGTRGCGNITNREWFYS